MLLQYDVKSKYAVWLICSYSILCCVFSKKLFLSCCVINMIIGIQQEAKMSPSYLWQTGSGNLLSQQ